MVTAELLESIRVLDDADREQVAAVIAEAGARSTIESWLTTKVVPTVDDMIAHPESILTSDQLRANIARRRAGIDLSL